MGIPPPPPPSPMVALVSRIHCNYMYNYMIIVNKCRTRGRTLSCGYNSLHYNYMYNYIIMYRLYDDV